MDSYLKIDVHVGAFGQTMVSARKFSNTFYSMKLAATMFWMIMPTSQCVSEALKPSMSRADPRSKKFIGGVGQHTVVCPRFGWH